MLKNYLKIAFRHISRNKGYVFINVIGLGIALACTMIAYVNWQTGNGADSFHENYDKLFRVIANTPGNSRPTADVATPLAALAPKEIAGVEAAVRYDRTGAVIEVNGDVFQEGIAAVDANFLDVFTFNLLEGKPDALSKPNTLLISKKKAEKYFGDASALGKILTLNPEYLGGTEMVVGGVFEHLHHQTSSLSPNFLVNIDFVEKGLYPDTLMNWDNRAAATFLLLKDPQNHADISQKMSNQYIALQNEGVPYDKRSNYILQPMSQVYMQGMKVNNNWIQKAVSPSFYWGPWVLALMILFTACLNFTNTSISFSNKRLKEMGVRKVMGGGRNQLALQLLSESLIICLLAGALAIILAEYLLPLYNSLWSYMELELALNYLSNPSLIAFLIGIIFLTALIGGAYPAFYVSSFKATNIFRGSTKFGGDGWLVRSLLGFQIITAVVAIIACVSFVQNAEFQKNYDYGYNTHSIINIDIQSGETFEKFRTVITENPAIQGVTGSRNNLGFGSWWWNIGKPEDNRHAQVQLVGTDFFKVMDLALIEGRPFDKNLETDYENSIIINKKLMEEQQWTTALGQTLEMNGKKEVIGVVEDFHASNLFDGISPNVFHFVKPERMRVMKVKVPVEQLVATRGYLESKWKEVFPYKPFDAYFQDENLAQSAMVSESIAYINLFLAIVSILLAATGLFSLVSLNFLKRAKEIAVRRVLGASPESIAITLNKHYLLIFGMGSIIGVALGSWFSGFLMEQVFAINNGVSTFSTIIAAVGICAIGALTIGGKLFGVLQTNPADTLKND